MASNTATLLADATPASPFDLSNDAAFQAWRDWKLTRVAALSTAPTLIRDLRRLTAAERDALATQCNTRNLAIYACAAPVDKASLQRFGEQLGLRRLDNHLCADEDAISSVQARNDTLHKRYIPYTDKALNWHTDGYYNCADETIRSFVLHCIQDAAHGGDNAFVDPEMVYLLLREADPRHVQTLMEPDVMTIPSNHLSASAVRVAQTGPVFSLDPVSGALHMRYTARSRSIEWKSGDRVDRARAALDAILRQSDHVLRHRLTPGQGVVANNVLHARTAFQDAAGRSRLLYRARYYERVTIAMQDDHAVGE